MRRDVDDILLNYWTNAFFMMVFLVVLLMRSAQGIKQPSSRKRTCVLIAMTIFYVLMDAVFITCHITANKTIWAYVVFVFYVAYTLLPFAWHQFVRNFVGASPAMYKMEFIPIVVLIVLVLLTPFTGVLWSFDADGMYVRGPLFTFYTYLNYFYYVEPLIYALVIVLRGKKKEEPYLPHSVCISLVPIVGAIVNNFIIPIYEIYPFQPFCSVVIALLAYFFMASTETDALQVKHQEEIQNALTQAQDATAQALEASQVKSDFLSNMSHDIRTPMNAIINLTQLAQKENDINVIHQYLDKISISSKFLLGLINDILDMSKIESGELTLNKDTLTRSEFLNTVSTVIQPIMDAKHLNFHSELNPGEYTILVDKLRFNQIFFNLLSNAAKFTPAGGDVWFTVTNLEAENNKLHIKFVVRDNGIGMSEEFLKHLFEPFAREHSELSNSQQGTGLGLPIVKSLVTAMGGTISVKSQLGVGSEFTVDIIVDIAEKKDSPIKPAEAIDTAKLSGMKLLLVEDNELNTYVAQIILEEAGCDVKSVHNGQEAVDTFKESAPGYYDAILMDVRMPVMDGLEATKLIRALDRPDATSTPIIAMTADAFDSERKKTLESGMNYHLSKPVDAQQIYDVLLKCRKAK